MSVKPSYPKRAQKSSVASRSGRRGKKASPWSRGPHVNSPKNRERMNSFEQPNLPSDKQTLPTPLQGDVRPVDEELEADS